jgi:hypothetical protein
MDRSLKEELKNRCIIFDSSGMACTVLYPKNCSRRFDSGKSMEGCRLSRAGVSRLWRRRTPDTGGNN